MLFVVTGAFISLIRSSVSYWREVPSLLYELYVFLCVPMIVCMHVPNSVLVGSCGLSPRTIENHLPNIRIGLVSGALNWQMNNQFSAVFFLSKGEFSKREELDDSSIQYPRNLRQLLSLKKKKKKRFLENEAPPKRPVGLNWREPWMLIGRNHDALIDRDGNYRNTKRPFWART